MKEKHKGKIKLVIRCYCPIMKRNRWMERWVFVENVTFYRGSNG